MDAELVAILKSLSKAITIPDKTSFSLYSDSLSSLSAIQNPYNSNPLVFKIKKLIQKFKQTHQLTLFHIKSHSNITGNDFADKLANEARTSGIETELKISKEALKKTIEVGVRELWNRRWTERGSETTLNTWIKTIYSIPSYFPSNHYQTQLLTNHGKFPYYFKKINRTQHSTCQCGEEISDFDHYINRCPSQKT